MSTEAEATTELPEGVIQQGQEAVTVTVPTETPAEPEQLLAGKFKTAEDLEKAYKELESKLGQQQPQQPAEAEATETPAPEGEEKETEAKDNDGDDPYAAYGEAVGSALKAAEVDPAAAQQEFTENGTLSEETFEKFAKAGFPKEMVEAYLRGVTEAEANATAVTEAQITQIKAVAGGDEAFAEMQQWMAVNMSEADLKAYNDAVSTGDFTSAMTAVSKAHAAYKAAVGTEGNLIGGKTAATPAYANEAEYLADMAKPEYKTSEAFRHQVMKKLAASPNVFMTR